MKEPGIKLLVRNIITSGEWIVVEMVSKAECKNGLNFDNTYAWVCQFDRIGVVVQVRAYLDLTLVKIVWWSGGLKEMGVDIKGNDSRITN
jgi:hypothetical protein